LAEMYSEGWGTKPDARKSLFWELQAAEQGNWVAQFTLSQIYASGKGIEINSRKAVFWMSQACNNPTGRQKLAEICKSLDPVLSDVDRIAIDNWSSKTAEQAREIAHSVLQNSDAGNLDVQRLKLAAEQGHEIAQYEIGLRYANGEGVPKDDLLAFGWFLKAAEQGNSNAQAYIGIAYAAGRGVSKDNRLSLIWLHKAAEQNNAIGQYSLGMMYSNGQGVSKDEEQAIRWFNKAASQGNVEAQFKLGAMYALGRGTTKDVQNAYFWWLLASAQGHQEAAKGRDIYERKLTSQERGDTQAAARVWKPVNL
jgi:TPR repeat protein